jgi:phosphoserine aminotransferase
LANTTSVFSIYVTLKMLRWVEKQGGVAVMEQRNREKSNLLYDVLDDSELYKAVADPENRSICNVTFRLDDDEMEKRFLEQSLNEGLYALKGHRDVGGIRASIYNSMPLEGVKALADFMKDFERRET